MRARARPIVTAFLCACVLGAGAAAASEPDPVAVVRAFYGRGSIRAYEFYSERLKALFIADEGPDGVGLDFAFYCNCQDAADGWETTLRFELVSRSTSPCERAIVRATFENGGAQDVRYALVRENGKWVIDDAQSVEPDRWLLSRLLEPGR